MLQPCFLIGDLDIEKLTPHPVVLSSIKENDHMKHLLLSDLVEIPAHRENFFHILLDNQNIGTRNAKILFLDREKIEEEDYFLLAQHYSKIGFLVVTRGLSPSPSI